MRRKHLYVIVLMIQVLTVFQAMGQEAEKDTISILRSMPNKSDLQQQLAQPSLPPVTTEPWRIDERVPENFIENKVTTFNFNPELKYLNSHTDSVLSLLLPAYRGLGDYQNYGGTLGTLKLTNKLDLNYGAFISVQSGYLFSTKQLVLGGNFQLQYVISNKLQFQVWGQYVTPGNSSDPTFDLSTFFPKTHLGAGLQYDSHEKTKIEVGVEYQYNQSDKTWKPESGGKVRFNF